MLERIELINFQRHELLRLRFSPTVTTIVGGNGAGKTAVVRALYWLAHNRPLNNHFCRKGAEEVRATLWVDGHRLVRERSEETNEYRLDSETYRALGGNVPEQVDQLLNIGTVNFQRQLDNHFIVVETAGDAARQLNAVVNLAIIDDTLRALNGKHRIANTLARAAEARVGRAVAERDANKHIPRITKQYDALKQKDLLATQARNRATQLAAGLAVAAPAHKTAQAAHQAAQAANGLVSLALTARGHRERARILRKWLFEVEQIQGDVRGGLPDTTVLQTLHEAATEMRGKSNRLQDLLREARRHLETGTKAAGHITECEQVLATAKRVCPTCKRPM